MPKVFYCSKYTLPHPRPVGKKCQQEGESLASDVEDAAPPSTDPVGVATVSDQILLQLPKLGEKMDSMDRRVQRTEAALGQGSQQASPTVNTSCNPPIQNNESHGIDTEDTIESVVPSLGYLRNNTSIQAEVDKRLAELAQINESASRGRLKSHRGGPGEVPVKKAVDWPQHFILTGNRKSRPSYDDLTITQWVSGFVRCIQEEKSGEARASMLDYLGNLMEDASDFSWESAKASHAVVLTNMEADRLQWSDTEKLNRIRRAHAQRHSTTGQFTASKGAGFKKTKNVVSKNGVICKLFQEGTCRFVSHHRTAGQFYRHVCEHCDGPHVSRTCTQMSSSKN